MDKVLSLTPREQRIMKEGYLNNYSRRAVRDSLTKGANGHLDICENLRLTYDLVYMIPDKQLREQITEKLIDVMRMAKRMADRLTYYKLTYMDQTGTDGKNIGVLPGVEERKTMRRSRP